MIIPIGRCDVMEIAQRSKSSLDAYRSLEYAKVGGVNDVIYREADKRLRQLRSIIAEVRPLCSSNVDLMSVATWPKEQQARYGLEQIERADRIELLTETFYWIGHRAAAVIRKMPGLQSFKAVGVRDVRNWMLEHVDNPKNGIPSAGVGWGGPNGPTFATNPHGQDKGLFVNAEEFFGEVHRVASRCIDDPDLIS
ncbi:hypothetical protein [Bradyrhizobium sp. Arg816]|uniref:hypothetical protein n=1 Tax=Bradyrhizobium sp. Arg816 TaxID=2998491 RepID=UPI00249E0C50|nr:hypothetical protein [Bradyrhizobium sp. Arg816]MDI3565412.1 hypothetical protein [Bradyrhizobium sp. Arg816]